MTELDLFDEDPSNKKVSLEKKDKTEEVKIDLAKETKESEKSDSSNSDDDLNLF